MQLEPFLKPGDRVRCVDASDSGQWIATGQEYTVVETRSHTHIRINAECSYEFWRVDRFKPVVRVKARSFRTGKAFDDLVERSKRWFESLTQAERDAHRLEQKLSWARGEKALGL